MPVHITKTDCANVCDECGGHLPLYHMARHGDICSSCWDAQYDENGEDIDDDPQDRP